MTFHIMKVPYTYMVVNNILVVQVKEECKRRTRTKSGGMFEWEAKSIKF
jgi:hypothetical protein